MKTTKEIILLLILVVASMGFGASLILGIIFPTKWDCMDNGITQIKLDENRNKYYVMAPNGRTCNRWISPTEIEYQSRNQGY